MKQRQNRYFATLGLSSLAVTAFECGAALLFRGDGGSPGAVLVQAGASGLVLLALTLGLLGRHASAYGADFAALEGGPGFKPALERIGGVPLVSLILFALLAMAYTWGFALLSPALALPASSRVPFALLTFSIGLLGSAFAFVFLDRLGLRTLMDAGLTTYPSDLREGRQRRKIFIIPLFMALMSIIFAYSAALLLQREGMAVATGSQLTLLLMMGGYFVVMVFLLLLWNGSTGLLYQSLILQLERLASERSLAGRIGIGSVDELGTMAGMINDFCGCLQTGLRDLSASYGDLASVQRQLFEGIRQSSAAASDIGASIEAALRAVEGEDEALASSLREARDLAAHVAEASAALLEQEGKVRSSREGVESVIEAVGRLAVQAAGAQEKSSALGRMVKEGEEGVRAVMENVRAVAQRSEDLGEINRLIAGVASRTNLLAMNAAIEAAHAGAAGAGFSVVAEEIRVLAESTAKHTKTSKESLGEILSLIESSLSSAESAGSSFGRISVAAAEVDAVSAEVATSMVREEERGRSILGLLAETDRLCLAIADKTTTLDRVAAGMATSLDAAGKAQAEVKGLATAMGDRDRELGSAVAGVDVLSARTAELTAKLGSFLSTFKL